MKDGLTFRHIHGGGIYEKNVKLDFSVNTNPMGMPDELREILKSAAGDSEKYPDYECRKLREHLGKMFCTAPENVICTSGASEAFSAVAGCFTGKRALIPVPSFFGYERAALAADMKIDLYPLHEKDGFCLNDGLFYRIEEGGCVFLGNPNNPTGRALDKDYLLQLISECEKKNAYLILDESFEELMTDRSVSMSEYLSEYKNLLIVRSFTKTYAAAGVRLGCILTCDDTLTDRIKLQLPEWNISSFAQAAGLYWGKNETYLEETKRVIRFEREYLMKALSKLGFTVYPSEVNFILFKAKADLYEPLLGQGILIRDCENMRGLGKGYYRLAVKRHEENEALVTILEGILNDYSECHSERSDAYHTMKWCDAAPARGCEATGRILIGSA